MNVRITYHVPKNLLPVTAQIAALAAAPDLTTPGPDLDALAKLDLTVVDPGTPADGGATIDRTIELLAGAHFPVWFPTDESRKAAVRNLYTRRIAAALPSTVTADEPVIS